MPASYRIAQVSPYAWEDRHDLNDFVREVSEGLRSRGHDVLVVAPSHSHDLVHASRRAVRSGSVDGMGVLGVGEVLPFRSARRPASVPVDVARTIEELLDRVPFDFVHVHEPFAPSAASAALRHSHALNVGSFHAAGERVLSTQVARRLVELLFGRLDGRTASFKTTRDLLQRFFPGEYQVIPPGADLAPREDSEARARRELVEIVYVVEEERSALRLFIRALRKLPPDLPWAATIWARQPSSLPSIPLARAIRDRVRFVGPEDGAAAQFLARAQIVVAASHGAAPSVETLLRGMAGGAVPVASRLPQYEEAVDDGELGLLFEPRDAEVLAGQLARLTGDAELRETLRKRVCGHHSDLTWARVADAFEELYGDLAARRHGTDGKPAVRKQLAKRDLIGVDLHMHTNHSHDCATPVEKLLETAKARGLGAIAITDHNEISGALDARDKADGIKVIVAEEVKTADQGEVIGLFIEEKIPRGLTLEETIAEIKRQGGLVYVPHPFDRMHSV
ncbi:MAG: glycosyltransferase, partial [Solirubrobacteraceae bacterium]